MKIFSIEAIPVRVPLRRNRHTRTAHGDHVTSDYVIVRVHTDEGLVGIGEATVAPRWSGETSASAVWALQHLIGPALEGHDPTDITIARRRMDRVIQQNPFTKAGVEMALWDLSGKAAGVPVYQLLGGRCRDVVPIKLVIGAFDLPQVRALAEDFLSMGARSLKVKTGIDPDGDVARVKLVREVAGPDIPITIDSNCGWNFATARLVLERLRPLNILVAEQPIPPGDNASLARLREGGGIPIMADESVFTLADAWNLARDGAVDVLSVYPGKNGGIAGSVEICHLARAAGLSCHVGSNLELGPATAAMLHLAGAVPNIDSETYPSDILGPHYHEADLLMEPLQLDPSGARVPDGPGLGVELDEEQVRKFRVG